MTAKIIVGAVTLKLVKVSPEEWNKAKSRRAAADRAIKRATETKK